MYYTERLAWIRNCRNITQREMANAIGIKQQQYARYENGINELPISYLILICKYLNLSADYILGLTDKVKKLN